MTFDKEDHKRLIMQLLEAATVPGNAVDAVYELRRAVENASIETVKLAEETS